MREALLVFALVGCAEGRIDTNRPPPSISPVGESSYVLGVSPTQVTARQHMGDASQPPLAFELRVPVELHGGGLPATLLWGDAQNKSVLQIELPLLPSLASSDEQAHRSSGVGLFELARLCWIWDLTCPSRGQDGYWRALRIGANGALSELQLALAMKDSLLSPLPYLHVLGVYVPVGQSLVPGDRVRLEYTGPMPGRATDWTGRPLLAHFRYRSFALAPDGSLQAGDWTLLADDQVQPLQILPDPSPAFVRALAPLDVQAGVPFTLAVVVTDRYGNPQSITGPVELTGGVTGELWFVGEWRKELPVVYESPGSYRVVAHLPGARSVYHYTRAWPGPPPIQRLVGDVHSHTGDGGAQRKFLGTTGPGDHAALYSRTQDALGYMDRVAGYDFGAVSEHAVRWDAWKPPAAIAADPVFQSGGACAGAGKPIPGLGDWWTYAQGVASQYGGGPSGRFLPFPAFEWHATHKQAGTDTSPLHRVVLFRNFDPQGALPILPGDLPNLPPQCVLRFLEDLGYGPDRALVVPHMMQAESTNIDWALTYADSSVASRSTVEAYHRVGELFSARAYDQSTDMNAPYGRATWTVFEGEDPPAAPSSWTYRYGWRDLGAHIGLIGSSDNHSQMPGVNDDMAPDGSRYHNHEPAGTAIVLAASSDRDGIFGALQDRRSYATTGVRAWMTFNIGGAPMGSEISRSTAAVPAYVELMAGMTVTRLEIWAARVGSRLRPYQLVLAEQPNREVDARLVLLPNPVLVPGGSEEWLYYVRAFLETPGAEDGEPDDAVWSSPIWVRWSR